MKYKSIKILILLAFFPLPLSLIGIDESITRLIIDLVIILLFFTGNKSSITIKFTMPILLISMISLILSETEPVLFLIFLRRLLLPILLFTYILNTRIKDSEKSKIYSLIIFLCTLQILVAIIKYIMVGIEEDYAGTFSEQNGSISTIFPLMVISFIVSKYLINRNFKYLVHVLAFSGIGYIGNKLAIFPAVALLFLVLLLAFRKIKGIKVKIRQLLSLTFLSLLLVFLVFYSSSRLKSNEDIAGIDWDYSIDFITNYESRSFESDDGITRSGRISSIPLIFEFMQSKTSTQYLFGLGPGDIVKTSLKKGQVNKLQYDYDLGYGSRLGIWWVFIQLGLLGVIIFIRWQWQVYKLIISNLRRARNDRDLIFALFGIGLFTVYLFDLFFYSATLITNNSMSTLYFIMLGLVLKERSKK